MGQGGGRAGGGPGRRCGEGGGAPWPAATAPSLLPPPHTRTRPAHKLQARSSLRRARSSGGQGGAEARAGARGGHLRARSPSLRATARAASSIAAPATRFVSQWARAAAGSAPHLPRVVRRREPVAVLRAQLCVLLVHLAPPHAASVPRRVERALRSLVDLTRY
eukprot:125022-Rhodomonas_salina.1